jgi:hypothetical protein
MPRMESRVRPPPRSSQLWLPALPSVDLGAVPVVQGVQLLGNGGDLLHPVLQIFTTSGILYHSL